MRRVAGILIAALALATLQSPGQFPPAGASAVQHALQKLQVPGSVLVIAAHPDDENSSLLAWLARGKKLRTGYLSLTRGEGGQNLLGAEQGLALGAIRTEELRAARRVDGAEQFFTGAVDFGFSKTAEETLRVWNREKVLGEVVLVIRKFQPDVVILEFSGTPADGHGHHQASAILGKEAYAAAADPKKFPEQLSSVQPWQAKGLLCDRCSSGAVVVEARTAEFDPVLGFSYSEIGGRSRSQHRSQGMGAPERRDAPTLRLRQVAGSAALSLTWKDVEGGEKASELLAAAAKTYSPEVLLAARDAVAMLKHPAVPHKLREVDETIAMSAGLWLDANIESPTALADEKRTVRLTALNRSNLRFELSSVALAGGSSTAVGKPLVEGQPLVIPVSWQAQLPVPQAIFELRLQGKPIRIERPILHRYVDRVLGERTRPFAVVPPVSIEPPAAAMVLTSSEARPVQVRVRALAGPVKGQLRWRLADGWKISPPSASFDIAKQGEAVSVPFQLSAPGSGSTGLATLEAEAGGKTYGTSVSVLSHEHIPTTVLENPAQLRVTRTDARILAKTVGYIMGAGDEIPEVLRELGCSVTLLGSHDLSGANLSRFDAVITGVRAFNTREDLRAAMPRLLEYVRGGGTFLVQHNTLEGGIVPGDIGPYPITIGRARVAVEDTPVTFLNPSHALLSRPNKIESRDFDGWVQERGLYFASKWDGRYETVLSAHDPGEQALPGGLLYARYGKGVYIFSSFAWFRQLPAGVPGAIRIFANLLSAGKVSSSQ